MGLDLAYTYGKTHAENTLDAKNIKAYDGQRMAKGIVKDKIYSSISFDTFRLWIENRIEGLRETQLINVSDGSYINGMDNYSCEEYLKLGL